MTAPTLGTDRLDFVLPADLAARVPPEARGAARDEVRLLVAERSAAAISHRSFRDLPTVLRPGDLLVANSSATIPAAVDLAVGGHRYGGIVAHLSTPLPGGTEGEWVVELRARRPDGATDRFAGGRAGDVLPLVGGGWLHLREEYSPGRLWRARVGTPRRSDSSGGCAHLTPICAP